MSNGAGSKVGLEVMPIASVTLSDGHGPGERADPPIWRVTDIEAAATECAQIR
jgi:hypothetical protein